jgi:Uma2 family endonuclease
MTASLRWSSQDLELLPENGKRYEIIDGELHVSRQPHYYHQLVCFRIGLLLENWDKVHGTGQVNLAPGVIFADDDDVAPDVIWISNARLAAALAADGKLHSSPELVIEVLSPGEQNERRDREAKLKLYSRRGAHEYWIIDWRMRSVEVYRRDQAQLMLVSTLYETDSLTTPLLTGFSLTLNTLFEAIPQAT